MEERKIERERKKKRKRRERRFLHYFWQELKTKQNKVLSRL
jgi:hypothetical protein